MPARRRSVVWLFGAILVTSGMFAAPSEAVPDLHGTWLFRINGIGTLVDIDQSGSTVSFPYGGITVSGTVSDAGRVQAATMLVNAGVVFDGDASADGELMNASAVRATLSPLTLAYDAIYGQRCGCNDGNTLDGDGCDADCQIEPCWSCTGTPSVCVPDPDGTPCTPSDCVVGATCGAGVCTGGGPVGACIDLTGSWWIHSVSTLLGFEATSDYARTILQHGGHLRIGDEVGGGREYSGTVDPSTGALAWTRLSPVDVSGLCSQAVQAYRAPYSGTAATSDGFTATGIDFVQVSRCPLAADVVETATRGTVPPSTTTTSTTVTTSTTTSSLPDPRIPIPARKLTFRDDLARHTRRFVFKSLTGSTGVRIAPPTPLGPGDPTLHGATLDVYNGAGSGEHVRILLPKEGWRALGGGKGFQYSHRPTAEPVSSVSIRTDRLSIVAGGAAFGYSLDEPQQGRIVVTLAFGTTPALCASVPAKATGAPPSTTTTDLPGKFVGMPNAPAPAVCPPAP